VLRILVWHVHGTWTTSFVQGRHEYLLPTLPEGGAWGGGRCGRDWPASAKEVHPDQLPDTGVDLVVLQRPEEIELSRRWLRRDVPAVYVEHNTPKGQVPDTRHPLADRDDIPLVHVTHFNELIWDSGRAPTTVVEHGVPDPGELYTGELDRAAAVINEPVRRWRVTGTDLLARFAPVDVFGIAADQLRVPGVSPIGDLPPRQLHPELARRRLYLHPVRWTSLGLSLIEAMHMGMPIVALAGTEAIEAVPAEAGVLSTRVEVLVDAVHELTANPELAAQLGKHARRAALARYGLAAFLHDWDWLLTERMARR
jgi:Glycosyl transferases group 1